MCRNARAARGHSGRPDAGRSGGGARFSARCRGPGSLRHRNSDKQSGCPGENRSRYRGDVRQGQSRCGSRSMAGSEPTPVAAELCHAWLILRTRPVLLEPGAVLAAVKDAARRTSERWPAAILDCCCARPPAGRQAGTKKRPPVSRTKKHDEVGNTGLPSKGVSLLPMINSEEAFKRGNGLYREILALFAFGLQRDEPLRCATPTRPCFAGRTAVFYGRTRPLADRLCRFPAHRNWSNALRHHLAYDIRQRHTKSLGPSRHLLDEAPFLTLGPFVDQDRGTLDDFPERNHPKAFKGLQEFVEVDPDLIGVDDDLLDGQFDRRCFLARRSLFSWSRFLCAFSRSAGHGNTRCWKSRH